MKAQLNTLLNKEMDRKDFLRNIGIAMMMLAGGGVIMQALGSLQPNGGRATTSRSTSYGHGYGSSPYGGR